MAPSWKNRIVGEGVQPASAFTANPRNWRVHTAAQQAALSGVLQEVGWVQRVIVNRRTGYLLDGHERVAQALQAGDADVPYVEVDLDEREERLMLATLDPIGAMALTDQDAFASLLDSVTAGDEAVSHMVDDLLQATEDPLERYRLGRQEMARDTLRERFVVPPFSVLDARQGYWKARKRAWMDLGIQSEVGRGGAPKTIPPHPPTVRRAPDGTLDYSGSPGQARRFDRQTQGSLGAIPPNERLMRAAAKRDQNLLGFWHEVRSKYQPAYTEGRRTEQTGTSVFDPVLCECAYTWWTGPGFRVLDPFAGGSVRGIVAAFMGRSYVGVELRPEQVEANEEQARQIGDGVEAVSDPEQLTPIETSGNMWLKRDDRFSVAGVRGGKVRTCWALAQGATGLVTAGSRQSPQVNIVAHIARELGIPCRVHTPTGELSPEVRQAAACGAEVIQHRPGYNTVIVARARQDAEDRGWREIPFGMECEEAVTQTRRQAANIPTGAKRLVVPVGSGMSLAGVLWGLIDAKRDIPVVGVCVGADPSKRLDQYAPGDWRDRCSLVESPLDYHREAEQCTLGSVTLDPIYEAKCLPYLEEGDCLWIVGLRATAGGEWVAPTWLVGDSANVRDMVDGHVDFLFSCPPYYDLEIYSDLPGELSAAPTYEAFLEGYRHIVSESVALLRQDRFACFVVGDLRDQSGHYRNFVSDTIQAFRDAGCHLYNEGILVTVVGSLAIRTPKLFVGGRKLGKTHQNVLVFVKGDWRAAVEACGPIEVVLPRFADALDLERDGGTIGEER